MRARARVFARVCARACVRAHECAAAAAVTRAEKEPRPIFGRFFRLLLCSAIPALLIFVGIQVRFKVLKDWGAWGAIAAFSFIAAAWYIFELKCLCEKSSADEYMAAVVFFYTDVFVLILAVGLLAVSIFAAGEACDVSGCSPYMVGVDGSCCYGGTSGDCRCSCCDRCFGRHPDDRNNGRTDVDVELHRNITQAAAAAAQGQQSQSSVTAAQATAGPASQYI